MNSSWSCSERQPEVCCATVHCRLAVVPILFPFSTSNHDPRIYTPRHWLRLLLSVILLFGVHTYIGKFRATNLVCKLQCITKSDESLIHSQENSMAVCFLVFDVIGAIALKLLLWLNHMSVILCFKSIQIRWGLALLYERMICSHFPCWSYYRLAVSPNSWRCWTQYTGKQ